MKTDIKALGKATQFGDEDAGGRQKGSNFGSARSRGQQRNLIGSSPL